jgi:hypothetical protein
MLARRKAPASTLTLGQPTPKTPDKTAFLEKARGKSASSEFAALSGLKLQIAPSLLIAGNLPDAGRLSNPEWRPLKSLLEPTIPSRQHRSKGVHGCVGT